MHLIYLHVEKSAGTSQRELFWRNYGKEGVAWKGLDFDFDSIRSVLEFRDRPVIGGHFDFPAIRKLAGPQLFTSVVREPLSRAISLFNFWSRNAPPDQRRTWRRRGLNPESMLKTIEKCAPFRRAVSDSQCVRLSGSRRFSDCRTVLESDNFLVGIFDDLDRFNERLGEILNWQFTNLGEFNRAGKAGYQDEILSEPGLKAAIESLIGEDMRLYEFVQGRSLYENLPDRDILVQGLGKHEKGLASAALAGGVELQLIGRAKVADMLEGGTVILRVENHGEKKLDAEGESRAVIAYHWINRQSGRALEEGVRTPLASDLHPGERTEIEVRVAPPKAAPPAEVGIRFSVLLVGECWLVNRDPAHGLYL